MHLGAGDHNERPRRAPWPADAPFSEIRVRQIDTLYAALPVGLLVLSGHPDPAELLQGAKGLLAGDTPPIFLLDLGGVPSGMREASLRRVWPLLPGWRWADSLLFGVPDVEDACQLARDWAETVFAAAPPDGPALPGCSGLRELAWAGWNLPVLVATPDREEYPADRSIQMSGFYAPETDGGSVWRWTGPERAARVHLPIPRYGKWDVSVDIASWGMTMGPQGVLVSLDGARLTPATGSATELVAGTGLVTPANSCLSLQLDLVCTELQPGTPNDPRSLGICVSGFVLRRQG